MHEVKVLDFLPVEAGVFYVMDRGCLDSLPNVQAASRRAYSAKTDRTRGVVCDQTIAVNGFYVEQEYPEHVRRIRFKDPESGKTLVFLINNTTLPLLTSPLCSRAAGRWNCSSNGAVRCHQNYFATNGFLTRHY